MMVKYARTALTLAAVTLTSGCRPAPPADPRMVAEWMHTLYGAIRVERLSPPVASRVMVYATSALYSGLTVVTPDRPTLTGVLNGFPDLPKVENRADYDGTLTAIAAERLVLDSLFKEALPTTRSAVGRLADSLTHAREAIGSSPRVAAQSGDLGQRIGLAIVAWSHGDGFDSTRGRMITPPKGPGYWVNDAPATIYATQNLSGASEFVALDNPANAMKSSNSSDRGLILSRPKKPGKTLPAVNMAGMSEPYWGQLRPFILKSWTECPPPPPPTYSADKGSDLFIYADEVRMLRSSLTPEQKAIAYYWADNAGESGTPIGHWVSIASQMSGSRGLSAEDAARLELLVSVALADAFIATWGYKYQYSLIRPRTYIRRITDPAWEPLIPTPPFPEYPSAHSGVSMASAEVLSAFFGDSSAFADSTGLSIGSAIRHFDSFRGAAVEAGRSRIYAGIHFTYGNLGGRVLGECVGDKVVERMKAERVH